MSNVINQLVVRANQGLDALSKSQIGVLVGREFTKIQTRLAPYADVKIMAAAVATLFALSAIIIMARKIKQLTAENATLKTNLSTVYKTIMDLRESTANQEAINAQDTTFSEEDNLITSLTQANQEKDQKITRLTEVNNKLLAALKAQKQEAPSDPRQAELQAKMKNRKAELQQKTGRSATK